MQGAANGVVNGSGVFRIDLDAFGVNAIRSITLTDSGGNTGGTGGASGFDLDFIKILSRYNLTAANVAASPSVVAFDFSNASTVYRPGLLIPYAGGEAAWNTDVLFGNVDGSIDFAHVTLGVQDISASTDTGGVSIGRGGSVTFTFAQPMEPEGLFLYFADGGAANDIVEVTVNTLDPPPSSGGTQTGTGNDDVIDASPGSGGGSGTVVGDGPDTISGLDGNDTLSGAGGNDVVYGNLGNDVIYGNRGDDTLYGGQGADTVFGGQDADVAYGNFQDDTIYGNRGEDTLHGGQGNDRAYGGQGNDSLFGNLGADTLSGNLGNDVMTGGGGADVFVYSAGEDRITDFDFGDGDRVLLGTGATAQQAIQLARAVADGVEIAFSTGNTLTIAGVTIGSLSVDWFVT